MESAGYRSTGWRRCEALPGFRDRRVEQPEHTMLDRWQTIQPTVKRRALVALAAGLYGGSLAYGKHLVMPWHPGDFAVSWFGAQAILHDANPYVLVGPGRVFNWLWNLYYPVSAMVVAIPFTVLPELAAVVAFAALSSALLGYAVTADGWYRLPLFFGILM